MTPLLIAVVVIGASAVMAAAGLRHRRVRNRWVSPYRGFRAAAARVTRTGDSSFDIAGAHLRPWS
jgi:hypothetical protein